VVRDMSGVKLLEGRGVLGYLQRQAGGAYRVAVVFHDGGAVRAGLCQTALR